MAASSNSSFNSSSSTPGTNSIAGNDKRNNLKGTNGNDYLDGGGGADTLRGGRGNDTLVFDAVDRLIDGGQGYDTLQVTSGNQIFSLNKKQRIKNIEAIDFASSGNRLTLTAADIRRVSENDQLFVTGAQGNVVDAGPGWRWTGVSGDQKYNLFIKDGILLSVDTRIQMAGFTDLPATPPSVPSVPSPPSSPSTPVPPATPIPSSPATPPVPPSTPAPPGTPNPGVPAGSGLPVSDARVLTGTVNNDELASQTPMDAIFGAAGNDLIFYNSLHQVHDGGTGIDTLRVADSGKLISLSREGAIKGIEVIDITGTGNTISLTSDDIRRISDDDTLTITGVQNNQITLDSGWRWIGLTGGQFNQLSKDGVVLNVQPRISIDMPSGSPMVQLGSSDDIWTGATNQPAGTTETVFGGAGNDKLSSPTAGAALSGQAGQDTLSSAGAGSVLDGGDGDDVLIFTRHDQTLIGGSGSDKLRLSAGNQNVVLEDITHIDGIEIIEFASTPNVLTLTADDIARMSDTDTLRITSYWHGNVVNASGHWQWTGFSDDQRFNVFTQAGITLMTEIGVQIQGINMWRVAEAGPGNFQFSTPAGTPAGIADYVVGGHGNDTLSSSTPLALIYGNNGRDILSSTAYGAQLYGGADNDTLIFNQARQILNGGTGTDTLRFNGSHQTASLSVHPHIRNMEEIQFESTGNTLTLSADDVGKISSNNHLVIKGPTANTIDPGSGWRVTAFNTDFTMMTLAKNSSSLLVPLNMNIVGLEKKYTTVLGPGNDVWGGLVSIPPGFKEFIYGSEGNDTLSSSTLMSVIHGGAGDDKLTTSGKDSELFGDAGNDTLEATTNVRMYGGDGNDTILFNSEKILVGYGGPGQDTFRVGESVTNGIDILVADFNRQENDQLIIDVAGNQTYTANGYLVSYGPYGEGYLYEIGYLNLFGRVPLIRLTGVELGDNLTYEGMRGYVAFG